MARALASVASRISNAFKLGMQTKQSMNVLVESPGLPLKFSSAESVLQRWYLVNVVQVDPLMHLLDVDTDDGVTHDIRRLRVQSIFEWRVVDASIVEVASLHIFPKKWKERVTQAPTSHGQLAERGQPPHILYQGLLAPLSTG